MFAESKHRQQEAFLGTAACVAVVVLSGYVVQSWAPVVALSVVFTLPLWVPRLVVALRYRAFEKLNGHEGLQLPNEQFDAEATKFLYNHPSANIRSRQNGVGLSDFFWYLLAPAHEVHQEHVEISSPKYQVFANVTKSVVNRPQKELVALVLKHAKPLFAQLSCGSWSIVNLRRWWMPVFVRCFYELVFDEECPKEAEKIIYDSAEDLIRALKFCGTRNMATRAILTEYLMDRVRKGDAARHFPADADDAGVSVEEKALFLQGVVFHTGSIQMAEAMAHLCLSVAQHKGNFDERLVSNPRFLGYFLCESLRLFPLFGIAHRITSEDITVPMAGNAVIPKGSVLCFNYPALHREGFHDPGKFDPHRFKHVTEQNSHFMPFGAPNNRPCPGRSISWCWMKVLAKEMLQHVVFLTPVLHTRSMPTGGMCLVAKRKAGDGQLPAAVSVLKPALMTGIWLYEQGSSVPRSVVQMCSGLYMLWHAQQLRLAKSWNERQDARLADKAGKA